MSIIAPKSLLLASLPLVVVGVDPDSLRTAYTVFHREPDGIRFRVAETDGGGRGRTPAPWGDVVGALALVSRLRDESGGRLVVVVESQLASGGAHSSDVEGCRRARWHWDAACTLLAVRCVHVDPGAWEPQFDSQGRKLAIGERKPEYRRQALALHPDAKNEDRAASTCLGAWWIRQQGGEVVSAVTNEWSDSSCVRQAARVYLSS